MRAERSTSHGRAGRATARLAAIATFVVVAAAPSVARATDMSGLAVVVFGMVLGVPAFVLLGLGLVVTLVARRSPRPAWAPGWAVAATISAPLLAFLFPASMLLERGARAGDMFGLALILAAPNLLLAGVTVALARGLRR